MLLNAIKENSCRTVKEGNTIIPYRPDSGPGKN